MVQRHAFSTVRVRAVSNLGLALVNPSTIDPLAGDIGRGKSWMGSLTPNYSFLVTTDAVRESTSCMHISILNSHLNICRVPVLCPGKDMGIKIKWCN